MSSIKVAVRCRPFTLDDRLGVQMNQLGDEEGEVRAFERASPMFRAHAAARTHRSTFSTRTTRPSASPSREQRSRSLGGAGGGRALHSLSQIVLVTAGRPRVDAQLFVVDRAQLESSPSGRRRQGRRRHDEVHRPADGVRLGWPEDQGGFVRGQRGRALRLRPLGLWQDVHRLWHGRREQ